MNQAKFLINEALSSTLYRVEKINTDWEPDIVLTNETYPSTLHCTKAVENDQHRLEIRLDT